MKAERAHLPNPSPDKKGAGRTGPLSNHEHSAQCVIATGYTLRMIVAKVWMLGYFTR